MAKNTLIPKLSRSLGAGIHFKYDSEEMLSIASKQVMKAGLDTKAITYLSDNFLKQVQNDARELVNRYDQ
ncbi:MAG: hypothetical protein GY786_03535 [Proteobacteria bacterium]|nr:hypothetical protein [Pseudomonadota bacterium]